MSIQEVEVFLAATPVTDHLLSANTFLKPQVLSKTLQLKSVK